MCRAKVRGLSGCKSHPVEGTGRRGGAGGGRAAAPSGRRRKTLTARDAGLVDALERELDPVTRGDPTGPLRWTCSSAARLARRLRDAGHAVSERTVNRLLHELGYSLQANRKTLEGRQHPDRDAQFRRIDRRVRAFQRLGQPVVSVDTKKKELVGPYRNGGREWRPTGQPEQVQVHDFIDRDLGKAIPYGVYDLTANAGWVGVGVDHDTSEFAVATLRRWWRQMGRHAYPEARRLLITADGGGSNGSRSRPWKYELQQLADALGLRISVCHFPPGTSKWNKIGASHVLPHHPELARPAAGEPRGRGQPDRRNDHQGGPRDPLRTRRRPIPDRPPDHRRADEQPRHQARPLPRRVELQPLAKHREWID